MLCALLRGEHCALHSYSKFKTCLLLIKRGLNSYISCGYHHKQTEKSLVIIIIIVGHTIGRVSVNESH